MSEDPTPNPDGEEDRIDVVAAILLDDLERPSMLMAACRTEPPVLAGGWEIPGGKIDPGESPTSALHREIREELGVGIVLGGALPGPLGGWWPLGERYRMRTWFATVSDGIPLPLEGHSQLRWLAPAHVWSVRWLPANRPIIDAALTRLWDGHR